jgi:hypothetical protein
MLPHRPLDETAKRPTRYWDQDGLPEVMLGLLSIASSGVFLVGYALPRGSSTAQAYAQVGPIIWAAASLAMRWGLKKLKERITFPRSGYAAALSEPNPTYWAYALGVVLLVGAGVLLLNVGGGLPEGTWMAAPGFAMLFAVALLVGGLRYKLEHMIYLAAFSLILGAWMCRIGAGPQGGLWVMMWLGTAMALTGAVRLKRFLKVNPRPQDLAI